MKNKIFRIIGYVMIFCGLFVLGFFTYRKISREIYLRRLLRENIIFEVPELDIKVPVLEGTDSKALQVAAGHFEGKGSPGKGNYCIAGHNSTIYAEVFNELDNIGVGDVMYVYDIDSGRTKYTYVVTDYSIVSPDETSVLSESSEPIITVISCTDDGAFRQVVRGRLQ